MENSHCICCYIQEKNSNHCGMDKVETSRTILVFERELHLLQRKDLETVVEYVIKWPVGPLNLPTSMLYHVSICCYFPSRKAANARLILRER